MQRLRKILRIYLVLAMIPLTIFSGRTMAGCVCADGHFEPFCTGGAGRANAAYGTQLGHLGCANCPAKLAAKSSAKHACCGGEKPAVDSGCLNTDHDQGCCHPLTLLPMMAEEAVRADFDADIVALPHSVSLSMFPVVLDHPVHVVNSGPPRVQLVQLQRFLL